MKFAKQDPIFFAGEALHRIKQAKVQQALERSDLDALVFFKAEAVRYLTDFYVKGFRPFMEPEYMVLVARGKPPAVGYISGSDELRIRIKSDIADARRLPAVGRWAETLSAMLSDYGLTGDGSKKGGSKRARIGTDLMPWMVHQGLMKQYPALEIVDASKIWEQITAVKHPAEIEHVRSAVRVADVGMDAAVAAIRPGVSEHAVSAEAVYAMRKAGSEFEPFIPLVASGYNTSMFERVATEKVIAGGEMVILDIGAVVRGYTGDLGRTFVCGEPTADQKAIYKATHLALQEAKKAVKPGASGRAVDRRAREVIEDSGWGKYVYTGNTGHQLGYGLHGEPLVDRNVDFEIVENMVICLEPRIVLPDRPDIGGAHLEDVVVVTKDGCEQINRSPHDEKLLG
ncbi:MAG: Xaa-Pro peptidase family protein [Reyranellaceae bacterium]